MADSFTSTEDTELLNSIASVHMMFGMYESAQSILQLSDWIERHNIATLKLLSDVYLKQKNADLALQTIDRLEKEISPEPLSANDIYLKARALALLGQNEEARQVMLNRGQSQIMEA
ncbi:MAG: hypothetical protein AAGF53_02480 [Pseudomonadota bacterium]